MTRSDFVHLHVHSEGSFLDGIGKPKEYARRAAQLGQPAIALTDHGNLTQAPIFYKECRAADVEPILGFEGYFVTDFESSKSEKDGERSHISVLARGARGYEVLSEFNTETWKQFYYKPLIDRKLCEALGDDAEHLTILSGCAGSQLSRLLMADKDDEAVEELLWWRETFPHYYIEIMHHGTDFDLDLNDRLLKMAERYSVPWVVTNDQHYCFKPEGAAHDVMLAIQMGRDIDDPDRMRFDGSGYYQKSRKEMYSTFKRAGYDPEVFKVGAANTLRIAKESRTRIKAWESKTWQIPKFPDTDDPYREMKRIVMRRMRELGHDTDPQRVKEVKQELKVIKEVGIDDFLLITRDIDEHARSIGIRVGPGRGSVAGSRVAYYMRIHNIDPVKYKLRFDRFLNPARPKMPDIDTDFQMSRRSEVFDYAIDKYGADNTMAVCQFGNLKVKAAFNSISKAFGIGFQDAHRLNKEIMEEDDSETGETTYLLPEEITSRFPEMTEYLKRLAGTKRGIGAHPAGLIIADPSANIRRQVPELWIPSSKRWVGQFDKKAIESMGFMKQDFLGLRTLDTIQECVQLVKSRRGIELEPDEWVPDEEEHDREVYRMLAKGRTSGVFQMEGPVNQRGCRDVRPKSFEDLVSITSLYRTGPIAAGYPKTFIENRKAGRENIEYLHPLLKPILEPTWGVILYQEQVMDIGEKLAGFDGVLVDEIKEAIKDKSSDEMDRVRPLFIEGCRKNKIKERTATAIWDIIEGYAGYGYNRSHAVAYTMLTYQTARLKYLYPIEYYSALLRTVPNDKDNAEKRDGYLRDAIKDGKVEIWPADINQSDAKATPTPLPVDAIRFGLSDLKGIGDVQAKKLLNKRPPGGYTDFFEVHEAANNAAVMTVLQKGSALTCLGVDGDESETERLLGWTFRDDMEPWRDEYEDIVKLPTTDGGDVDVVGMIYSVRRGQTKTGKPYMTWKIRWDVTQAFDIRMWSDCQPLWHLKPGAVVRVKGEWQLRWQNITVPSRHDIEVLLDPEETVS